MGHRRGEENERKVHGEFIKKIASVLLSDDQQGVLCLTFLWRLLCAPTIVRPSAVEPRPWRSSAVSNGLARLYGTIGRRGLEKLRGNSEGILPGRPWRSPAVSNGLARLYGTIGRRGLEKFREESYQDVFGAAPQCQTDWRGCIGPLGVAV